MPVREEYFENKIKITTKTKKKRINKLCILTFDRLFVWFVYYMKNGLTNHSICLFFFFNLIQLSTEFLFANKTISLILSIRIVVQTVKII